MPSASPLTTVRDETALLTVLQGLMKREQECLVGADTDALPALTVQKSQLIGQLAQLSRQRHQALAAAGCAASEEGMQAWLDAGAEPAAGAPWQELLSATRLAKELNRINGMLINKQMAHNQAMISAMRSPANGAEPGFYGPSGQASSSTPSRGFIAG